MGSVRVNLFAVGGHTLDDVGVLIPSAKFLAVVDLINPSNIPPPRFALTIDVDGYIAAHNTILKECLLLLE